MGFDPIGMGDMGDPPAHTCGLAANQQRKRSIGETVESRRHAPSTEYERSTMTRARW